MAIKSPRRFLALDELLPTVDAAGCFRFEKPLWWRYRVPSPHLVLIESGRVEARTPEGVFHGKAGDMLCFRSTEWNEYGTAGPTVFYQASFRFAPPPREGLTPYLAEHGPLPIHVPLGKTFGKMRNIFEMFCIEVPRPGAVRLLRLRAGVHEMLAIIAASLTRSRDDGQQLDEWQRMRMRLDTELNTDLSVEAMAARMNLSASYFKGVFKQRFGVGPKAYHTRARLQEAVRLLRSTDKPVKAIAYELGFSSARVFARLFKGRLGVLPSDIREGATRVEEAAPEPAGRLFPMNVHFVPPSQTMEDWIKQCIPRRRGRGYKMAVEWKPEPRA